MPGVLATCFILLVTNCITATVVLLGSAAGMTFCLVTYSAIVNTFIKALGDNKTRKSH